jgi:Holliday junction resolvase RusA-like endonuclease
MVIRIDVDGMVPVPGGSKTPGQAKSGRLFVRAANKNTPIWMAFVAKAARAQYTGPLMSGPVFSEYEFRFPRPKHHFQKNGELKPDAPYWHTNTPDMTKVIRSTEDALTGIVWEDDKTSCNRGERKVYCKPGQQPGVTIYIWEAK